MNAFDSEMATVSSQAAPYNSPYFKVITFKYQPGLVNRII